jgi:hypothetical protein
MSMRRLFGRYAHAQTIKPLCADDLAAAHAQTIWPICACADLAAVRMRRRFGRCAHTQTIWPLCACADGADYLTAMRSADDLAAMRKRRRT